MDIKLTFFEKEGIKKTFSVVYQKIEREKLNKMTYLHTNFS